MVNYLWYDTIRTYMRPRTLYIIFIQYSGLSTDFYIASILMMTYNIKSTLVRARMSLGARACRVLSAYSLHSPHSVASSSAIH
jgi:hypothetical protein